MERKHREERTRRRGDTLWIGPSLTRAVAFSDEEHARALPFIGRKRVKTVILTLQPDGTVKVKKGKGRA
jgi:hypothetical protein